MGELRDGDMEKWNNGIMECWNNGMSVRTPYGRWNIDRLGCQPFFMVGNLFYG